MFLRHLIVFFIFATFLSMPVFSHSVDHGKMHFPETNGNGDDVVKLTGFWQFYYGKHLNSSEMERLDHKEKYYLASPSNWGKLRRNGEHTPVFGIATYYLKITVDTSLMRQPRNYAFRVGDVSTAYQLIVNGIPIMQTGCPTQTKKDFKPGYYPHVGVVHTDDDTLRVILHVSNFFYPHYSGISRSILFGQEKAISREHLLLTALSIFLICIFGCLFLFELLVYIYYPNEKSHLLVSLLSLIFLIKMLLDKDMTIFHLFPNFSFEFGYRLWLLCLLAIPLMFSLLRQWFPAEMNRWITLLVHGLYGLMGLAILFLPLAFVLQNLMPIIYFSIVCVAYLFAVVVRAMIRKRAYAAIHFISFTIAVACVVYDLMTITDPNRVYFISQFGIGLFLLALSSIILIRFIRAHTLSIKLAQELEATNQNLERIVQKRTNELLLTNTKLEKVNHQKNFLLATTTHDLKNSFNILINCSDILVEDETLTNEQKEYTKLIHEATYIGYRVLENILSWSQLQITEHDCSSIIRDCSTILKNEITAFHNQLEKKALQVQLQVDENLPFFCDEEQFYSIFRNLISNAIKFSLPGNTISISNKTVGGQVEFCVHDNGVGMDPQIVNTLFDNTVDNKRRGTAGESGTGLGLIIVKELVESNNGSIRCNSESGKGTDFFVRFPRQVD